VALGSNNRDAQFADAMKLNEQHIALAFRVPLQILGIGGTTFSSTEALMQFWLAGGLNFCLNHIEVAFDALFALRGVPEEYTELDTDVLLRSALKDRIESYAAGTRAGIFAPNEVRAKFELPKAKDGEEPRMQQQDVPLSYGAELEPPKPAAPAPEVQPEGDAAAGDSEDENKFIDLRRALRRAQADVS
jgi:phage portal protein BeeE